jgi:hypothetical protein
MTKEQAEQVLESALGCKILEYDKENMDLYAKDYDDLIAWCICVDAEIVIKHVVPMGDLIMFLYEPENDCSDKPYVIMMPGFSRVFALGLK